MFSFLKDKLKQGIAAFSKKIDEEGKEEVAEFSVEEKAEQKSEAKPQEKRGFFSKFFKRDEKKEDILEKAEEPTPKAAPFEERPIEIHVEPIQEKVEIQKIVIKEQVAEPPIAQQVPEEVASPEPVDEPTETVTSFMDDTSLSEELSHAPKEMEPEKILDEDLFEKLPNFEETEEIRPIEEVKKLQVDEKEQVALLTRQEKPHVALEMLPKFEKKEGTEEIPEKKGFFSRLTEKVVTKKIDETQFDELFWGLEVGMLENNVAMGVIEKIKSDLRTSLVGVPIRRNRVEETISQQLRKSIESVLSVPPLDLFKAMEKKKPYVICFVGINGSGKTTSIAKVAKLLLDGNKKVVLAAADTFRAAAIDQLQIHADKLGVKLIRQEYGADPAAVAFDAVRYAEAKNIDAVLIDTAGRLHSNTNLVDEMKKIVRVAKPDLKIFVGEAITGNDCIEQAEQFNLAVGIDGIILAKADIDEKGGAALSVSFVTHKPILFLGVGQEYGDLKRFNKEEFVESLGLTAGKT